MQAFYNYQSSDPTHQLSHTEVSPGAGFNDAPMPPANIAQADSDKFS